MHYLQQVADNVQRPTSVTTLFLGLVGRISYFCFFRYDNDSINVSGVTLRTLWFYMKYLLVICFGPAFKLQLKYFHSEKSLCT